EFHRGSRPTCEVLIRVVLRCMFLSSPAPACDPAYDNTIELVTAPPSGKVIAEMTCPVYGPATQRPARMETAAAPGDGIELRPQGVHRHPQRRARDHRHDQLVSQDSALRLHRRLQPPGHRADLALPGAAARTWRDLEHAARAAERAAGLRPRCAEKP